MSEIVRKKTTGEPGNPGEFGSTGKAGSGITLAEPGAGAPPVETTLSRTWPPARNYSRNPTIDVEILNLPLKCRTCCGEVVDSGEKGWLGTVYRHADPDEQCRDANSSDVSLVARCAYCGTDDPDELKFVQASWSDESRCSRCGGVSGYAIGD